MKLSGEYRRQVGKQGLSNIEAVFPSKYKLKFIIRLLRYDFGDFSLPYQYFVRKFVRRTLFLRIMSDSRVKDFFYPGNAVHGEPDYGLADNFVLSTETYLNTTYPRVQLNNHYLKLH